MTQDEIGICFRTPDPDAMMRWAVENLPEDAIRFIAAFETVDNDTGARTFEVEVLLSDTQAAVLLKAMWSKG